MEEKRHPTSNSEALLYELLEQQKQLKSQIENAVASTASTKEQVSTARDYFQKRDTPSGYSLAGPRLDRIEDSLREQGFDLGYGNGQTSRPQPEFGLNRPLMRPRRNRWSRTKTEGWTEPETREQEPGWQSGRELETASSGHPEGQVGGGPGGHHGSPIRGQRVGEIPGGPAALETYDDEEERGRSRIRESPSTTRKGGSSSLTKRENDTSPSEQDQVTEETQLPNSWFAIRRKLREPLAEWLSTMVLVLIGVSGNLQVKTSEGQYGSFSQEAAMWGLGTMMAIYIAGGVSGAHCNPMISISLSIFRGFPARKCLIYIVAQILGAFCAVWIAYGIYADAIMSYDPQKTSKSNGTGTAFFTLPGPFVKPTTAFFTDFTSAAVFTGSILAMGDDTNSPPGAGMHAFIIGLVAFALASTFGYNTGPQTNPAKDIATRIIPWLVGYGAEPWQKFWWVEAWGAAISGGIVGCLVYDVAVFEGPESPVNFSRWRKEGISLERKGMRFWIGLGGRQVKGDLECGGERDSSDVEEK